MLFVVGLWICLTFGLSLQVLVETFQGDSRLWLAYSQTLQVFVQYSDIVICVLAVWRFTVMLISRELEYHACSRFHVSSKSLCLSCSI
ncbi:hypothetical protein M758_1G263200 [Ceratodon purpureus]|nr:hypothetical protein M758_1G263200 [Ceratodon purpureus]